MNEEITKEYIYKKTLELFTEYLKELTENKTEYNLTGQEKLKEDLDFDDLALIEITLILEYLFKIEIDDGMMEEFITIDSISAIICKKVL
jgi:acyl carrier protein